MQAYNFINLDQFNQSRLQTHPSPHIQIYAIWKRHSIRFQLKACLHRMFFFVNENVQPNFTAAEDFDSCSCSCCQATERTAQEQERSEDGLPPGFQKKIAMGDASSWCKRCCMISFFQASTSCETEGFVVRFTRWRSMIYRPKWDCVFFAALDY